MSDNKKNIRSININTSEVKLDNLEWDQKVSDKDKFILAKKILVTAVSIFVVFSLFHIFKPSEETQEVYGIISEFCKTVILLVVGFYFGSSGDNTNSN